MYASCHKVAPNQRSSGLPDSPGSPSSPKAPSSQFGSHSFADLRRVRNAMCLAIPAQVIEFTTPGNAIVNLSGVRREISLALVEDVQLGDYVIVHVGFALQKLDEEEAQHTLALFAQTGV